MSENMNAALYEAAKKQKKRMEKVVVAAIEVFENQTGLTIEFLAIEHTNVTRVGDTEEVYMVSVESEARLS